MAGWPNGITARLAWAGMRHRPGGWLLLALGIALAACLPVVSLGLRTEASAAAVQVAVARLPASQRAVLAVTPRHLGRAELAQVDQLVRGGFTSAGLTSPDRLLTFRPLALAAADVTVGAVEPLPSAVRLTSGRLPHSCRPTACEVLAVSAPGGSRFDPGAVTGAARSLGLLFTGTAELTDQRLLGVRLVAPDLPLLLGGDPRAMAGLTSLELFGRNTAWVASVDGPSVAAQGVATFSDRMAAIADDVNTASGQLTVDWPAGVVSDAAARVEASAARFGVLGFGAGALQLGFCLVAAAAIRRRQQQTGQLLTRRGGSGAQLWATAVISSAVAVAAGLVVGVVVGTLVVALRGRSLVAQPWPAALSAVTGSWATLAALGLAAVLLSVAMVLWPAALGRSTRLVLDVTLVAVVAVALLVASTGAATSGAGSVVVLVASAAGLVAARLWPTVVGAMARSSTAGPVRLVALVAGRRRPLLASVTAGFLAATCCMLVFVSCYRGSLLQSAADQAAAQVPLDVRVAPSAESAAPWDVLDSDQLPTAAPHVVRYPVVSSAVTTSAGSATALNLPLTGIDPQLLPAMHEFRATTGSDLAPSELARRLAVAAAVDEEPLDVPAGTKQLTVRVSGVTLAIDVSLWVATRNGRERQVPMVGAGPELTADVAGLAPATVRAVEIAESAAHVTHRAHATGEGTTDRELASGALVFGAVTADRRPMPWSWRSWGSDQGRVDPPAAGALSVRYQVGEARVVLTPHFLPRAALPALRVATDPDTAARARAGGVLSVTVNGVTVPAQIVAVLPRMPTLGDSFLLADRTAVTALLTRTAPGTATVTQVWIDAPGESLQRVRDVLDSSSATTGAVSYRLDRYRAVLTDPVATRFLLLLSVAGLTAFLLALLSVATAIRADLEQSGAEHFALELDGAQVGQLRRVLLLRWLSTLAVGAPVGVAAGFLLAVAAVRMLLSGPDGTAVVPPLRLLAGLPTTAAVIATAVLAAVLVCVLVIRSAFGHTAARPPEQDLR